MTVTMTPNAQVLVTSPTTFELRPTPTTPLYSETPRTGLYPWLYETINPALSIECVAAGVCPGATVVQPELITGMTLTPGHAVGTGPGCSILVGPVSNIPEMQLPLFAEPSITYGSIAYPTPVPVGTLLKPLTGYYSERYFYDAEYIFATYYATQTPSRVDKMTLIDPLVGKKTIPLTELSAILTKADNGRINKTMFPGEAVLIPQQSLYVDDPATVITSGNPYLEGATADVSAWIKFKPSEIEQMIYYYTLTVTHTCPPFITRFYGTMTVQNNWNAVQKRLQYYLNKAQGIIPDPDAST
jgi:hypothetical protein